MPELGPLPVPVPVPVPVPDPEFPALIPPSAVRPWLDAIPQPIAVTGGTGFVGSHLVDTLCEAGLRPRVLVRDPASPRWIAGRDADWVAGSLEDHEALRRLVTGAGTVVHLAGVVRAGSAGEFDHGNRVGTENLVSAVRAARSGARLVLVSSLAAAGPSPEPAGLPPEAEPRPLSAYGRSKLGGEVAVRSMGDGWWWTILRPPAIYGPRDTDVFQFFRMAAAGLMVAPSGERWVTVAHVADVVRAILAAAAGAGCHRVLHLGEPTPYRLDRLLATLAAAGGVRARLVRVPGAVLAAAGAAGSGLQRLGFRRVPMTADKARELRARHWSARTAESLALLGLDEGLPFARGATATWAWYRASGWLR